LILDHVNGIRNDNRLENLRIVCPNCAATLDTHCGRSKMTVPPLRTCPICDGLFRAKYSDQRYCSVSCAATGRHLGVARPRTRKVERPPYPQLMEEIEATSYLAVGRRYGVSDNAVRRWVRFYERETAREERGEH
jgi:hypothetical protein